MQSLPSPEDARFGHPLTLRRPPHLLPPQRSSVYVGVIVAGALVGEKVRVASIVCSRPSLAPIASARAEGRSLRRASLAHSWRLGLFLRRGGELTADPRPVSPLDRRS
jgi:hypothetical protein